MDKIDNKIFEAALRKIGRLGQFPLLKWRSDIRKEVLSGVSIEDVRTETEQVLKTLGASQQDIKQIMPLLFFTPKSKKSGRPSRVLSAWRRRRHARRYA